MTPGPKPLERQRWMRWKNTDTVAAPPYAMVFIHDVIPGDDTSLLFKGKRTPFSPFLNTARGINWNTAFNNGQTVESGEYGLLTFDLPAWSLVGEGLCVGDFATFTGGVSQDWSLQDLPDDFTSDISLLFYNGLLVIATMNIPEFVDIWRAKEPDVLDGAQYKIALVGGLSSSRIDETQPRPAPESLP